MKKKELVYLELLEGKSATQLAIATKLNLSLSTVNNALAPLREIGAVKIYPRRLEIIDKEKVLIHWANCRNLYKDIIYKTRVSQPIAKIESEMPQDVAFTAYSAYRFKYVAAADYSEIYVYSADVSEIRKRFPERRGPANLYILKMPEDLKKYVIKNNVPDALMFVDLWNLKEWYAKEFVNELRRKIL